MEPVPREAVRTWERPPSTDQRRSSEQTVPRVQPSRIKSGVEPIAPKRDNCAPSEVQLSEVYLAGAPKTSLVSDRLLKELTQGLERIVS